MHFQPFVRASTMTKNCLSMNGPAKSRCKRDQWQAGHFQGSIAITLNLTDFLDISDTLLQCWHPALATKHTSSPSFSFGCNLDDLGVIPKALASGPDLVRPPGNPTVNSHHESIIHASFAKTITSISHWGRTLASHDR